ncbi:MAG: GntR family transcriptional regulator [Ardenticatenaceae bacterium]|nr:GntR family transcriptional regulator [Ardenticatenaceae bacterium]HBY99283.1 hypothetical protein [Chloroflexota bacterium]
MKTEGRPLLELDSSTIERDSPVPLYYQIQQTLLEMVESGMLKPGDEVPTEKELVEQFEVSRATVRRALDELVRQGYITRQQGRGTYVSVKLEDTRSERLRGFLEDVRERGLDVGCEILFNGSVPAPPRVARVLQRGEDQRAYLIRRVGIVEGEPMGLAEVWLAVDDEVDTTRQELAQYQLLYTYVERLFADRYGIRLVSGEKTLQATVATPEDAALLHTEPGAPLLLVQVVIYSSTGKPVVFIKTLYRGDRYVYATKLHT